MINFPNLPTLSDSQRFKMTHSPIMSETSVLFVNNPVDFFGTKKSPTEILHAQSDSPLAFFRSSSPGHSATNSTPRFKEREDPRMEVKEKHRKPSKEEISCYNKRPNEPSKVPISESRSLTSEIKKIGSNLMPEFPDAFINGNTKIIIDSREISKLYSQYKNHREKKLKMFAQEKTKIESYYSDRQSNLSGILKRLGQN